MRYVPVIDSTQCDNEFTQFIHCNDCVKFGFTVFCSDSFSKTHFYNTITQYFEQFSLIYV